SIYGRIPIFWITKNVSLGITAFCHTDVGIYLICCSRIDEIYSTIIEDRFKLKRYFVGIILFVTWRSLSISGSIEDYFKIGRCITSLISIFLLIIFLCPINVKNVCIQFSFSVIVSESIGLH